jgi:hypothetical protein
MSLPKNWAPQRAEHVVREFVVDFCEIGIPETTLEEAQQPEFWQGVPSHHEIGDEIRLIGRGFDTKLSVAGIGPAGVVLEDLAAAPAERQLFICRKVARGDWLAIWAIGKTDADGFYGAETTWEAFAPGQSCLPTLIDVVADSIDRRGPFPITVTSWGLKDVKSGCARLDQSRAKLASRRPDRSVSILCPEGRWAPDLWTRLLIERGEAYVAQKFVKVQISVQLREIAERMRDTSAESERMVPLERSRLRNRPDRQTRLEGRRNRSAFLPRASDK